MSETNEDIVVAFYKRALFENQVEDAFRLYDGRALKVRPSPAGQPS